MADDAKSNADEGKASGGGSKMKFIVLGIPIILVQTVVAYLLASYVIIPKYFDSAAAAQTSASNEQSESPGPAPEEFGQLYKLTDNIVNPSGSKQYVVLDLGVEVRGEPDVAALTLREAQIRDFIIQSLTGKTVSELDGPEDKAKLKDEISEFIKGLLPRGNLYNVYFIKFIVQ